MAARTFAEIAESVRRDPYPFPMPDGKAVVITQPTLAVEAAAVKAATAAATLSEGLLAGLAAYAGEEDGQKIADAYLSQPVAMLAAAVDDMREHFTGPREANG